MPQTGGRLYHLGVLRLPGEPSGRFSRASANDRELLTTWIRAFSEEGGQLTADADDFVETALAAGQLSTWRTDHLVSIAAHTEPIHGVSRIRAVYTPPSERCHGYASACVGKLSQQLTKQGIRCILYTDLANPISNSIYRRLGFVCTSEVLRYRFINSND